MKGVIVVLFSAFVTTYASPYWLSENVVGDEFYRFFEFESIPDPTHGRVNYVDEHTARTSNLTYAKDDTFVLRADDATVLNPDGPGRNSVRIRSRKTYTNHVAVFNIRHMPQGCGTWAAVRETLEANQPYGGVVDIIEGVNDQAPNLITLHTTSGCTMPSNREQTGTTTQLDCDVSVNHNAGCGVKAQATDSYGPSFNNIGGGWYAMERQSDGIKMWFWPRNDPSVPQDVKYGEFEANPEHWGVPVANFPNTSCDFNEHFSEHNIIINLTLCGDWAGNTYSQSGCPSTCIDFVNNNPGAFKEAYFDFESVNIYLHPDEYVTELVDI
ncbi:glycoside hydrolase family 16 protein [Cyathus striatus]|nr:glycoside hydrolase family 16 protein [Cyathus striatus]